MNIPGFMLAAPKSGSGKTTITCAMIKALKDKGLTVGAFKCGPDYIDPMFHREVLEVSSGNLDLFFTDEEMTRNLFAMDNTFDVTVVEGVMGIFDGLGGISSEASSYHLAVTLGIPVVLIIDAHGMGRSVVALVKGFQALDTSNCIKGIILNRISKDFYPKLKGIIEEETGMNVLGYLPNMPDTSIESRYLGLKLPNEIDNIKGELTRVSEILAETVNLNAVLELAKESKARRRKAKTTYCKDKVRVAIARDEAFCFYYRENLKLLEDKGVTLVPFSPLCDKQLPKNVSGLILGGGYPEKYAKGLSENTNMLESIRKAAKDNMPILAECGGFMYLHDELVTEDEEIYKMAGVIDGKCYYTGKLVRFGYITLEEKNDFFLQKGKGIKGHEFHYYDSTNNGVSAIAKKPTGNREWECAHINEYSFCGFGHLYYPSRPEFVESFVEKCKGVE